MSRDTGVFAGDIFFRFDPVVTQFLILVGDGFTPAFHRRRELAGLLDGLAGFIDNPHLNAVPTVRADRRPNFRRIEEIGQLSPPQDLLPNRL